MATFPYNNEAIAGVAIDEQGPTTGFDFEVCDAVSKVGGDYKFDGFVVAKFNKRSGERRFVVEDDRGVLHVYSAKNLKPRATQDVKRRIRLLLEEIAEAADEVGHSLVGWPAEDLMKGRRFKDAMTKMNELVYLYRMRPK